MTTNVRTARGKRTEDPSERLFRMAMFAVGLGMLIGAVVAPEKGEPVTEPVVSAVSE